VENKKEEKWTGTKIVTAALFAIFVAAVVSNSINEKTHSAHERATTYSEPKEPKKTWREEDNSSMASVMIEDFVKARLKSPSTADFQGVWSGRKITKNGTEYTTRSYVDSQNGFGAMLRTNFVCTVKQISKDEWQLVAFKALK